MTFRRWSLLSVALLLAASPFAQAKGKETAADILRKERKHLECMVSVVRTTPHTDHARYEIVDGNNSPVPAVKWRYLEEQMVLDIQFNGQKSIDGSKWFYMTAFGGMGCAAKDPEIVLTGKIADIWKTKCGVLATILCA